MSVTGDLFADPPAPPPRREVPKFVKGSPTSEAAAEAIAPTAGTLRARVLDYLKVCGAYGATDEEVQKALAMNPSTQRPRRIELFDAGLVVDSGEKRKTRSGRNAVVWRAC